ncbi:MAG: acyl-CoA synthetase (AMP-forming)/AMP-acid ligase II [Myxococcota bacterium]|jgi:acyl-CoA synthetase (AMP-forming)/AMP-acid ligase II
MQFNLADLFEANADAFPDRTAIICGDEVVSFGQLDRRATQLAHYWQQNGIGKDDHIGLVLYNSVAYLECMLAAWKLRARTINVNYRYVAEELRYLFDNAGMVAVICEPDLADEVEAARTEGIRLVMQHDESYQAAVASGSPERDFPPRSEEDLFILYTGGTTGMPRGVMWQHRDLFFAALQGGNPGGEPFETPEAVSIQVNENGEGLHICAAPPLIHGSSQLACWIALFNGGLAGLVPGRSFRAEALLDLCERGGMHTLNIVGDAMALPLIEALEANPGRWSLDNLLIIASAGAVLSGTAREKLEALLPSAMCLNSFGSSETGHQGAAFYEDGKPIWIMDDTHTVVLDDDLKVAAPGVVGRLARFGHIPLGYFGDPEKTARTFVAGADGRRYVIPGDMAMYAEDETIVFLGRGAACINTGGEKVYAEEVEEALKSHPHVFDAVVVGVPDERWGQRVEAVLTARTDTPDLDGILAHCRERVAGYKVPKVAHVVADLHRQPSGKPNYGWARQHAIDQG